MKYSDFNDKLVAVDLDGVLCVGEAWTDNDCLFAEPVKSNVEVSNKLYFAGAHIVIYTARPEGHRCETEYWLRKNGVRYHALVMNHNKMGADYYVDDKALSLVDFNNIE
jgi:uncharacterized HAD superfamily protein